MTLRRPGWVKVATSGPRTAGSAAPHTTFGAAASRRPGWEVRTMCFAGFRVVTGEILLRRERVVPQLRPDRVERGVMRAEEREKSRVELLFRVRPIVAVEEHPAGVFVAESRLVGSLRPQRIVDIDH